MFARPTIQSRTATQRRRERLGMASAVPLPSSPRVPTPPPLPASPRVPTPPMVAIATPPPPERLPVPSFASLMRVYPERDIPRGTEEALDTGDIIEDGELMTDFNQEYANGRYYRRPTYLNLIRNTTRNPYTRQPITNVENYHARLIGSGVCPICEIKVGGNVQMSHRNELLAFKNYLHHRQQRMLGDGSRVYFGSGKHSPQQLKKLREAILRVTDDIDAKWKELEEITRYLENLTDYEAHVGDYEEGRNLSPAERNLFTRKFEPANKKKEAIEKKLSQMIDTQTTLAKGIEAEEKLRDEERQVIAMPEPPPIPPRRSPIMPPPPRGSPFLSRIPPPPPSAPRLVAPPPRRR